MRFTTVFRSCAFSASSRSNNTCRFILTSFFDWFADDHPFGVEDRLGARAEEHAEHRAAIDHGEPRMARPFAVTAERAQLGASAAYAEPAGPIRSDSLKRSCCRRHKRPRLTARLGASV